MTALYDYDKYGCPMQHGDNYFFYKKAGLQSQFALYKQVRALAVALSECCYHLVVCCKIVR
jgi:hypothetical protein